MVTAHVRTASSKEIEKGVGRTLENIKKTLET
jgi:hypothetical protein